MLEHNADRPGGSDGGEGRGLQQVDLSLQIVEGGVSRRHEGTGSSANISINPNATWRGGSLAIFGF